MTDHLARKWAEQVDQRYPASALEEAARDYILAHIPAPTMAGRWDNKTHFLAGATYGITQEPMVMIGPNIDDFSIDCVAPARNSGYRVPDHLLTPNGKRYRLVEDVEPGHPATLTTLEDYEDAPMGTVVEERSTGFAFIKVGQSLWCNAAKGWGINAPSVPGDVLRWGETDKPGK
ncbi:hypothetical protein [Corynebacterium coyleae]|uniref:hypothetical protein n=1 Tax=Corynebacterium coyleae TaxID=53374 RepID=UPI00254CB389|nr:hypothetical protein [Corynebacterium coyleae]MDK8242134.1 hypothetical protein [Corynebacterium coyleae]